ncbi:RNA polymerase sigma-70 factor [Nocardia stercoris]|uniref:RNA polymerase sigma-70 factor n=1 Tax=Nocardia stercoris TaxID=2483361 RepID=A0A3M2KV94_9NOCA|nr:RNA polymerase sigma-70 factor [Nocardia stercoris]RMI28123.1 RNA polymerase sigma-70 factor [Nocardia stercoris]
MIHTVEGDVFEAARPRLEAIAYRMLGSASDAEDAVQDTYLRWQAADREYVETPEAWLTTVLTNLCRNQLGSARARRETYVGYWLPEPVFAGDSMLGPADTAEQRESVSLAMLTLMERLSPNERVVYVLREAFGYQHAEIADMLELTEANCQQIYRRAKQHVASARTRQQVDDAAARRIVEEFLAAAMSGKTDDLVRLLTDDAFTVGDGGGYVYTRKEPLVGALVVARFLRGLFKPSQAKRDQFGGTPVLFASIVNGAPAVVVEVNGQLAGVIVLDVTTDGLAAVFSPVNPDKLGRAARGWAALDHGKPVLDAW